MRRAEAALTQGDARRRNSMHLFFRAPARRRSPRRSRAPGSNRRGARTPNGARCSRSPPTNADPRPRDRSTAPRSDPSSSKTRGMWQFRPGRDRARRGDRPAGALWVARIAAAARVFQQSRGGRGAPRVGSSVARLGRFAIRERTSLRGRGWRERQARTARLAEVGTLDGRIGPTMLRVPFGPTEGRRGAAKLQRFPA